MIKIPAIRAKAVPQGYAAKVGVMINGALHIAHGFSPDKAIAKQVARNVKDQVLDRIGRKSR